MISEYRLNQKEIFLKPDLGAEVPIYLYYDPKKDFLLYGFSILELLRDPRVKRMEVNNKGLAFLLQNGVVPPPLTAYKYLYVLGMGDSARVSTEDGSVKVLFNHEYPFLSPLMDSNSENNFDPPNADVLLELVAQAVDRRVDPGKRNFLFHSAGKDSNLIALALAQAGWSDKFELVTHRSKGSADESQKSKNIAKKLGFKHRVLKEFDTLDTAQLAEIKEFFSRAPFPCVDNVTLAYPLYRYQMPELSGSNVLDGSGNDSYLMLPPSQRDQRLIRFSKYAGGVIPKALPIKSESILKNLKNTPAEWFGLMGFSVEDCSELLGDCYDAKKYWLDECEKRKSWSFVDFKTDIMVSSVVTERHIRKVRNFCDAYDSKLIMPLADGQVISFFRSLPEKYLFDRKSLKNKVYIRKVLKDYMGLDSDALGKKAFTYDSHAVLLNHERTIVTEIEKCDLWRSAGVKKIMSRLLPKVRKQGWSARYSKALVYRLYLISCWYNNSIYIDRGRGGSINV